MQYPILTIILINASYYNTMILNKFKGLHVAVNNQANSNI